VCVSLLAGIDFSNDKLLQTRVFSYTDTQRYRLGVNYQMLPVNQPKCPFHNNHIDGQMNFMHRNEEVRPAGVFLLSVCSQGRSESLSPGIFLMHMHGAAGSWEHVGFLLLQPITVLSSYPDLPALSPALLTLHLPPATTHPHAR